MLTTAGLSIDAAMPGLPDHCWSGRTYPLLIGTR